MTRALFIAALSLAGCKTFDAGSVRAGPRHCSRQRGGFGHRAICWMTCSVTSTARRHRW